MWVTLGEADLALVVAEGQARNRRRQRAGSRSTHGLAPEDDERVHIIGCGGECAFARAFDLEWPGDTMYEGDVAGLEVRTTVHRYKGELKLYDSDPEDRIYVLVYAEPPRFWIRGYYRKRWGIKPEWWWAGGRPTSDGAWCVPHEELCSPESLRRLLRRST